MAKNNHNGQDADEDNSLMLVVEELRDIKSLLVLLLAKGGAPLAEIGKALGVDKSTVSRQFGLGTVKPLRVEADVQAVENEG